MKLQLILSGEVVEEVEIPKYYAKSGCTTWSERIRMESVKLSKVGERSGKEWQVVGIAGSKVNKHIQFLNYKHEMVKRRFAKITEDWQD